ncbi:MAG: extracellular solute-binding protein [Vallitalea sp.]|nr:extracellular solute-binding protein [Vallitalea sp.]
MSKIRVICILLIFNLLLSGCKKEIKEENFFAKKQPIEISIGYWNIENALSGRGNDKMLQELEEKLNIKLIPYDITHDDARQKVNLWASASQLPDIVAIDAIGTPLYYHWIDNKIVKPLPKDLSRWPNLNSYMNSGELYNLKHSDGNYYGIPRKTYDNTHSIKLSGMDRKIYYRYDLAKKVGITKEPETYDEYRTMIKTIMEYDPENKNIEGMTVTVPFILDCFFLSYSVPLAMSDGSGSDFKWIKKNNKYIPAYFGGNLEAALKLARDMYKEGTIASDVPLAKEQQSIDKFINGSSVALLGNMMTWEFARRWNKKYPEMKFEDHVKILPPLQSMDGNYYGSVYKKYWSESYITTNDPIKQEAILNLFEYLLKNEEMFRHGYKDEDYISENGVKIAKPNIDINKKYPITLLANLVQWNNIHRYLTLTGDPIKDTYYKMDVEYSYKLLNTTLPKYYEVNVSMRTPTMNNFLIKPAEDLIRVMIGKEDVSKMYEDLMSEYKNKGLFKMIDEVNELFINMN